MKSSKLSTIRDARLKIAKSYTQRDLATNLYNFISYSKTEGTPLNWILKTFDGYKIDDLLQALGELSFNSDIVPLTKGVYTIAKYAGGLGQIKGPWQMTQDEFFEANIAHGLGRRVSIKDIPLKGRETLIRFHQEHISKALEEGKPVPQKVLQEYPELVRALRKSKCLSVGLVNASTNRGIAEYKGQNKRFPEVKRVSQPLPPDAQNIQELSFNSDKFTCYGKPTGRGFRAYCRRK